jgi:hypothetical protein
MESYQTKAVVLWYCNPKVQLHEHKPLKLELISNELIQGRIPLDKLGIVLVFMSYSLK